MSYHNVINSGKQFPMENKLYIFANVKSYNFNLIVIFAFAPNNYGKVCRYLSENGIL